MWRIVTFCSTAIVLSAAAMADDTGTDDNRSVTSDMPQLNTAGFLFDDALTEDGNTDSDEEDDSDDGDSDEDRKTSDEDPAEDEDEEDDG